MVYAARIVLLLVMAIAALSGCGDYHPDDPIGEGGWLLTLETGRSPEVVHEYPVSVDVEALLFDLSTGNDPADGTVIVPTSSGGEFENGLASIDTATVDGRSATVLQIDQPGRYRITAEAPQHEVSCEQEIIVGL
jgi:hypothetical protein